MRQLTICLLSIMVLLATISCTESQTTSPFEIRAVYDARTDSGKTDFFKMELSPPVNGEKEIWVGKETLIDTTSLKDAFITKSKPSLPPEEIEKIKNHPEYESHKDDLRVVFMVGGQPQVNIHFNNPEQLESVTGTYKGKRLALILDNKLLMAATVFEPISGGIMQIPMMSEEKATAIVQRIKQLSNSTK